VGVVEDGMINLELAEAQVVEAAEILEIMETIMVAPAQLVKVTLEELAFNIKAALVEAEALGL
jgi:hypothetical protein